VWAKRLRRQRQHRQVLFSIRIQVLIGGGVHTVSSIQTLNSTTSFTSDFRASASCLVRRNCVVEVILVHGNLVADAFCSLCGRDLVCGVGCWGDICLLNCEAASEGSCDCVVSTANGADVAG
jgi:hypothetical protein